MCACVGRVYACVCAGAPTCAYACGVQRCWCLLSVFTEVFETGSLTVPKLAAKASLDGWWGLSTCASSPWLLPLQACGGYRLRARLRPHARKRTPRILAEVLTVCPESTSLTEPPPQPIPNSSIKHLKVQIWTDCKHVCSLRPHSTPIQIWTLLQMNSVHKVITERQCFWTQCLCHEKKLFSTTGLELHCLG